MIGPFWNLGVVITRGDGATHLSRYLTISVPMNDQMKPVYAVFGDPDNVTTTPRGDFAPIQHFHYRLGLVDADLA